jgi:glycosyltransferase involved in cell wall biosynthesis
VSRVVFYDPFLDVLGGGEKYLLTIVEDVAGNGDHDVLVLSPHPPDVARWQRLGVVVDPQRIRWRHAGMLGATALGARADLFVTLTNHFPPLSMARRSTMIVQFPFARVRGDGPVEALRAVDRLARLRSYDTVLCYSSFVAGEIRDRLNVRSPIVIPPPVDLPAAPPAGPRRPRVLAVGRFFPSRDANNKKHALLIDAWRRLEREGGAEGWELHLAGGLRNDTASVEHFASLQERARGAAIRLHPNIAAGALQELYGESTLFWHAAGYGETAAERHEHFGITTVEAMAHGCVPVVIGLGGQREIVEDGVTGRLWDTLDELVAFTRELIADPAQVARLRSAAALSAKRFGKPSFVRAIRERVLQPAGVHVD